MISALELPHGPLMIDIGGTELTDGDRQRLLHPLVGGLILFSRNFKSTEQLARLTEEIHELRSPRLLIAIDHEGGRVQRCRDGFTRLPPMRSLGKLWDEAPQEAVQAAQAIGFVLAAELRMCNVDLSFTPVLDLDWGRSGVIGDRAFHGNVSAVIELAGGLIDGLHGAGMRACGKHFPGHGWAMADSHVAMPVDDRDLETLQTDIEPYRRLSLDAVMPAHVIYPDFDTKTSGFSTKWNAYLRNNVKFNGVVFSDDLSMQGASVAGDVLARTEAAWSAGCDMLLLCNAPDAVDEVVARWQPRFDPMRSNRVDRLLPLTSPIGLRDDSRYRDGLLACHRLISQTP